MLSYRKALQNSTVLQHTQTDETLPIFTVEYTKPRFVYKHINFCLKKKKSDMISAAKIPSIVYNLNLYIHFVQNDSDWKTAL